MANNYKVDDYWKESFSSIISKDHFAKFLKGYPFQVCELEVHKYNDFFELSYIRTVVENGKKVNYFIVKKYAYFPLQGCYGWVVALTYSDKNIGDMLHLFVGTVCMDYEYHKKHNLGFPKVFIHPMHHLHSGKLSDTEDYFVLCDLFNYDPTTKYISLCLDRKYRKTDIKGLFSDQIYLSGSIYDLYITVEQFPLVSKASVLDKHLVYLEELWEEFLKENKNFNDELTNRSIQWS